MPHAHPRIALPPETRFHERGLDAELVAGPPTPLHVEEIPRLFPDAQFVHLVRDGRDCAASLLGCPGGIAASTRRWPPGPR